MKRPRYIDFVCPVCHCKETRFVETNDDGSVIEAQTCKVTIDDELKITCFAVMEAQEIGVGYVQTINKRNSDFAERQRERLEKRSTEHWLKKGRHEAADRIKKARGY
jgi:hypothetical protein